MLMIRKLFLSEEAATAVEYAIMASLIAAVIVSVVVAVGLKVYNLFNAVDMPWSGG